MLETTYIRLHRAAEFLQIEGDSILVAAAERRIMVYALIAESLSVDVYDEKGERWGTESDHQPFVIFVPLDFVYVARLLRDGTTGEITHVGSIEDDLYPYYMRPNREFRLASVSTDQVFLRRQAVVKLKEMSQLPPAGTVKGGEGNEDRAHVSDPLIWMQQAARHFWINANKDDPSTHPGNDQVAAWLQKKGLSATKAEHAASLIRPSWAHNGRKPER